MSTTEPIDGPEAPPVRRPLVADVPKRNRTRLAKAELLMLTAVRTEQLARQVDGTDEVCKPFSEWPDDDPLREVAHRYGLGQADIARLLRGIAQEMENSSMRRGYEDAWR